MKKNYSEKMVVQEWMVTALIELMKENRFEDITVSQIAAKAGVSRMTYYRNYVSKEDILRSYTGYLTELLAQRMRQAERLDARAYWRLVFSFIYEKRSFITALISSGKAEMILDNMNENVRALTAGKEQWASAYAIGGLYNLMCIWARGGFRPSPEKMAVILTGLAGEDLTESVNRSYMREFDRLRNG